VHRLDLRQGQRFDLAGADRRKDEAAEKPLEPGRGRELASYRSRGSTVPEVRKVELCRFGERRPLTARLPLRGRRVSTRPHVDVEPTRQLARFIESQATVGPEADATSPAVVLVLEGEPGVSAT
jgi:hypothetical protein